MHIYRLRKSPSVPAAVEAFRQEVAGWAEHCRATCQRKRPTDQWDQALFLAGWMPVLPLKPEHPLVRWADKVRDSMAQQASRRGLWRHGYWREIQIDRGMAHFELFLGNLWQLNPQNERTVKHFLDAAEHLPGGVDDVPPWFDWSSGLFRESVFGTDGLGDGTELLNLPIHFHAINVALLAFQMGGGLRYLDLASLYGCHWADAIIKGKSLPLGLTPEGPVYELNDAILRAWGKLGSSSPTLDSPVARAEAFLANDAVRALLKLWQFREDETFLLAAERLIEILLPELSDPEAGALAAAIRHYRYFTGSRRFDRAVLDEAESSFPYWIDTLSVDTTVFREGRPEGVGKRADLPFWLENGMPRQHNPILLGLAAEITGNDRMAARSLDLALGYFRLARMAFPDGREQANSARSVHAVAIGHGRDAQAGMVSEVLRPLMHW